MIVNGSFLPPRKKVMFSYNDGVKIIAGVKEQVLGFLTISNEKKAVYVPDSLYTYIVTNW